MKKFRSLIISLLITASCLPTPSYGQWETMLTDVVPAGIFISPGYSLDKTLFLLDNGRVLWRSCDQGLSWTKVLVAGNQAVPELISMELSADFLNDSTAFVIKNNGEALISRNGGTTWSAMNNTPLSITGIASGPASQESGAIYALTALGGPENLYFSGDSGASWNLLCNLAVQCDGYPALITPDEPGAEQMLAVLTEKDLKISANGGLSFSDAFDQGFDTGLCDFAFSPLFQQDSTVYLSDWKNVWINPHGGKPGAWIKSVVQAESHPIRIAVSSSITEQRVIYATSAERVVKRSFDNGQSWENFGAALNMAFHRIEVTPEARYTVFLGIANDELTSGKLLRSEGINGMDAEHSLSRVTCYPNPATVETNIGFTVSNPGRFTLAIYNLQGMLIGESDLGTFGSGFHSVRIPLCGELSVSGMYLCRLQSGNDFRVFKIAVR